MTIQTMSMARADQQELYRSPEPEKLVMQQSAVISESFWKMDTGTIQKGYLDAGISWTESFYSKTQECKL